MSLKSFFWPGGIGVVLVLGEEWWKKSCLGLNKNAWLRDGFLDFIFCTLIPGEMIHFDWYFLDGSESPTRVVGVDMCGPPASYHRMLEAVWNLTLFWNEISVFCLGKFKFCRFFSPQIEMKKPHGKTRVLFWIVGTWIDQTFLVLPPGYDRWKGAMLWSDSTVSRIKKNKGAMKRSYSLGFFLSTW